VIPPTAVSPQPQWKIELREKIRAPTAGRKIKEIHFRTLYTLSGNMPGNHLVINLICKGITSESFVRLVA
jgi:hypothetical protein